MLTQEELDQMRDFCEKVLDSEDRHSPRYQDTVSGAKLKRCLDEIERLRERTWKLEEVAEAAREVVRDEEGGSAPVSGVVLPSLIEELRQELAALERSE